MKSFVLVAIAATSLLGACASTQTASNNAVASTGYAPNAYGRDLDARRINAINNVARTNGVDVHWINYPEARPTANAGT